MATAPSKAASSENGTEVVEPKKAKTLVVRLLADYWDKDGVRRSASYIDEHGEFHETGALLELDAAEARQLVKTPAAERGDEY